MRSDLSTAEKVPLVREAVAGNAEAHDELVHQYAGLIHATAFVRPKYREAAEDLVQEVFIRVFVNLGKLTRPEYFTTWISRIARVAEFRKSAC